MNDRGTGPKGGPTLILHDGLLASELPDGVVSMTWDAALWGGDQRFPDFHQILALPFAECTTMSAGAFFRRLETCLRAGARMIILVAATSESYKPMRLIELERGEHFVPEHDVEGSRLLLSQVLGIQSEFAAEGRAAPTPTQLTPDFIKRHVERHRCRVVFRLPSIEKLSAGDWMEPQLEFGVTQLEPAVVAGLTGEGAWIVLPWSGSLPKRDETDELLRMFAGLETLREQMKAAADGSNASVSQSALTTPAARAAAGELTVDKSGVVSIRMYAPNATKRQQLYYRNGRERRRRVTRTSKEGELLLKLADGGAVPWSEALPPVSRLRNALKEAIGDRVAVEAEGDGPTMFRLSVKLDVK